MFNKKSYEKRVLFVGIPDMAYICLDGLHASGVNIVGVMGAKKDHATYNIFKRFVNDRNLNFIEFDDLKAPEFIEKIKNLNVDIAVVCSFNYKVPKVLLDSVKDGFINVHPSLLPNYRGSNPYSTVLINNEPETGVTLHFMDEHFDTGDIILQKKLQISPYETMGTLFNRLNVLSFKMLLDTLNEYEEGDLARTKQPSGDFIQGSLPANELYPIDFNNSAEEISRFIRALNPFLVVATGFRHNLVKVLSAEFSEEKTTAKPGTITKIENDKIFIATGKGLLIPTAIQFGSFFAGTSKDFINIINPKIGESFDNG